MLRRDYDYDKPGFTLQALRNARRTIAPVWKPPSKTTPMTSVSLDRRGRCEPCRQAPGSSPRHDPPSPSHHQLRSERWDSTARQRAGHPGRLAGGEGPLYARVESGRGHGPPTRADSYPARRPLQAATATEAARPWGRDRVRRRRYPAWHGGHQPSGRVKVELRWDLRSLRQRKPDAMGAREPGVLVVGSASSRSRGWVMRC